MLPLFMSPSTTVVLLQLLRTPPVSALLRRYPSPYVVHSFPGCISLPTQQHQPVRLSQQLANQYVYAMNTAYIRASSQEPLVQINFHYVNADLQVDRVFNLSRSITETVDSCLGRIKTNLEKELQRKQRKKKTPKGSSDRPVEVVESGGPAEAVPTNVVQLSRNKEPVDGSTLVQDVLNACPGAGVTDLRLQVFGVELSVCYNLPWVNQIVMPSSMLTGYSVYPTKLDMECAELRDCDFQYFKEVPGGWEHVGESFQWRITPECLGRRIKLVCTPKNGSLSGPSVEIVSKNVVLEGPTQCLYEPRHRLTTTRLAGNQFRVVSFNLLADYYADSDYSRSVLFSYCPANILAIDYRKQLFIAELLGYHADVMCLQEVDAKIFDYDFVPIFGLQYYAGTHQRKGTTSEGLATFYNTQRFDLIEAYGINIGEQLPTLPAFADLWATIRTNPKLADRISARSTAVQVTAIRSKESGKVLLVANTHLYFHPDADHIRLLQFRLGLRYVQHVHAEVLWRLQCAEADVSIVFCGDFNSVPECGVYKLMTEGHVPADFVDFSSNAEEALTGVSLDQPFSVDSAYHDIPFTNYTAGFTECIDYIFYQTDDLRVVQVVPLPDEDQLKAHVAVPSVVHPSDHIALVADLEWRS